MILNSREIESMMRFMAEEGIDEKFKDNFSHCYPRNEQDYYLFKSKSKFNCNEDGKAAFDGIFISEVEEDKIRLAIEKYS